MMKMKVFILCAIGLTAIIAGVMLIGSCWTRVEPRYQGRTASYWLAQENTTNQMRAFQAFHEMGKAAVPVLVWAMERKDSAWQKWYLINYPKIPNALRKHLTRPISDRDRWNAAAVMAVNVDARAAVPDFTHLLATGNRDQQFCAIRALLNFINPQDTNCLPVLIDRLQSGSGEVQGLSFICLERMESAARPAVPVLTNLLASPNREVQEAAMRCLNAVDPAMAEKYKSEGLGSLLR